MTTERITIIVSEKGSRTVRRNLEGIGESASASQSAVTLLSRALGALGVGMTFSAVIRGLSNMQNANRQLEAVIRSTGAAAGWTTTQLGEMARSLQRNSIFDTTEITNAQTRLLSYSGVLGENIPRAMQAIIDQSARLNISLEQSAETIGRALETPSKAAAALSRQGFGASFTDEVLNNIKALEQQGRMLEAQIVILEILEESYEGAGKAAQQTFGGALRTILNLFNERWQSAIGNANAMNDIVRLLVDNAETLARALYGVAAAVLIAFGGVALNTVGRFFAILARNPFTVLGAGIVLVLGQLIAFSDQITLVQGGVETLADWFRALPIGISAAFQEVWQIAQTVWASVTTAFGSLGESFTSAFSEWTEAFRTFIQNANFIDIVRAGATGLDRLVGIFAGAVLAIINAWDVIPAAFRDIFTRALNGAISIVERGTNWIIRALNNLPGVEIGAVTLGRLEETAAGGARRMAEAMREGFMAGWNQDFIVGIVDKTTEASVKIAQERIEREEQLRRDSAAPTSFPDVSRIIDHSGKSKAGKGISFDTVIDNIKRETAALSLSTRQREIENEVIQVQNRLKRQLTATEEAQLRTLLELKQERQEEVDLLEEINGAVDNAAVKMATLNRLFNSGAISIEQYNDKMRELRLEQLAAARDLESGIERGLLRIQDQFGDVASVAENALVNAFQSAEDALVQFVSTGKLDFRSLVDSILQDLTRLAIRQSIIAPLANALGMGGNAGGGIQNFMSSMFGGGSGLGGLFSGIGNLLGFENGGKFTVGGSGGPDSQLVAFRATPGEEVYVRPKGQATGGERPVQITYNITTPDAESFQRSQSQILARTQASLNRANTRNN